MDDKDAIISDLRALVADLRTEIKGLRLELAKAKKDSSTSPKSPSSDIVKPPKKKTNPRKKPKQGGQQGHKRQLREPLPENRVDEFSIYEINDAEIRDRVMDERCFASPGFTRLSCETLQRHHLRFAG